MTQGIHPAAPHHLPVYIPRPDGSDPLFTVVVVSIVILCLLAGVIYFKLHSLPEQMGERANSTQLQLISILAILALFTHNNAFWVLALLIAAIRLPDYLTPLQGIAKSLGKIAANQPEAAAVESTSAGPAETAAIAPAAAQKTEGTIEPVKTEKEAT
jgi:hypothetical protein